MFGEGRAPVYEAQLALITPGHARFSFSAALM